MAACGSASGDGSKTPLNSTSGAVPFSCDADAITMNKCTRENAMIPPYPPMIFLVICVLGNKTISIQRYCGPKVATEKACLILSLDRMDNVDKRDVEDSTMEEGSIMERLVVVDVDNVGTVGDEVSEDSTWYLFLCTKDTGAKDVTALVARNAMMSFK